MKNRRFSLPFLLAIAACTSGAAGWSSDVCGCIEAWYSLAYDLNVTEASEAEELTLPVVQAASEKFIGKPLALDELPDTGMGDSCKATLEGAICEWQLWEKNGALKGYVADFRVSRAGRIVAVLVRERTWVPSGGA